MIRLIAMDYDMTLFDHRPDPGEPVGIREVLLEKLRALRGEGVLAGIASGRSLTSLQGELTRQGIDPAQGFPAFLISFDVYRHVADAQGVFRPDEAYNEAVRAQVWRFCRAQLGRLGDCLDGLAAAGLKPDTWQVVSEYGIELRMGTPERAQEAMRFLEGRVSGAELNCNQQLLNLMPPLGGKGAAVAGLAASLGVAPGEALGLGDSLNDLSMLDGRAGLCGGTVGNGDPIVKAKVLENGGYVGKRRCSLGILDVLRDYGL